MALALALLLLQAPLTPEQIHAEDAKVIEAALVHYYSLERPNIGTMRVPDVTAGPSVAENGIVDTLWDERRRLNRPIPIDPKLRASFRARNAYPISLAWFQPENDHLRLFSESSRPHTRDRGLRQGFLLWILMPGYAEDRLHAAVSFGFQEGMHAGRATIWLTKADNRWKVNDVREEHYL